MRRSNGNFSAYVKKTLAAEYQRQTGVAERELTDKKRSAADSSSDNQSDNKRHNQPPPIRGINVSIGNAPRIYTKE